VPEAAKSLALICDDPDAPLGTWVHWVAYGIPVSTTGLPEGVPAKSALAGGGTQGTNDFKQVGYGGPCPPKRKAHHYHFKIYALDAEVDLPSTTTKANLVGVMQGHVVGTGELVGTYQRR
jgi:Raf kinase inhibitor-like YbhB/YbcL family protein